MVRPIAVIVWAIGVAAPNLPDPVAKSYAQRIHVESKRYKIDPFTLVSIIRHESRFRASAISKDGEDYGLGQIRARYRGACRKDKDPVNNPSPACKAVKARLLHGPTNIGSVARAIDRWKTCRKITGKPALFARWLHGYGGMGSFKRKILCGMKKRKGKWRDVPVRPLLKRIINYRRMLIKLQRSGRRGDPTQACPL